MCSPTKVFADPRFRIGNGHFITLTDTLVPILHQQLVRLEVCSCDDELEALSGAVHAAGVLVARVGGTARSIAFVATFMACGCVGLSIQASIQAHRLNSIRVRLAEAQLCKENMRGARYGQSCCFYLVPIDR